MSEHTKERWATDGRTILEAPDARSEEIPPRVYLEIARVFKPEDARRIVACVNACAGIPTEVLEDHGIWRLIDAAHHLATEIPPELYREEASSVVLGKLELFLPDVEAALAKLKGDA